MLLSEKEIRDLPKIMTRAITTSPEVVAKAQLRRVIQWGQEYCVHQNRPRRECGHCWNSLLEEVQ